MKLCRVGCGRSKPKTEFWKAGKVLAARCKPCQNLRRNAWRRNRYWTLRGQRTAELARMKAYAKADPELISIKRRARYQRVKGKILIAMRLRYWTDRAYRESKKAADRARTCARKATRDQDPA